MAEKNKDPQNLGLFKETLAVLFGLNQKTIDRVMAIVSNSEDKLNVKTYIIRDKSGPRAVEWLRKAIAYARTEGSQKHEDDVFDLSKDQDLESTARIQKAEQHEFDHPEDEVITMDKPIKECTFKDYLMELQVSDDPAQALQDVKTAVRNPERYAKQRAVDTVQKEREVQQAKDDPNQAEKLQLIQSEKQTAMRKKRLADKEKKTAQEMGAARPVAGMA